jgi:4-amino-4-deoxy-L-arabinose transferase-like glycosyltransferase
MTSRVAPASKESGKSIQMISLRPATFVLLLALLALGAVFFELGRMDVVTDNEGQRAAPPAEMLRSGDFLVPTLNGEVYLAKPPLLYWVIAGVYSLAGEVNELFARTPTAVCGALLVLSVYIAFRRRLGEEAARYGALGALAAPYVLERARIAELDVPLVLATFWTVMLCDAAWNATGLRAALRWAALAGVALAAAAMLKGPVPFLFVAAAFLAHVIVQQENAGKLIARGVGWSALAAVIGLLLYGVTMLGLLFRANWSLPFPLALTIFGAAWAWLALRHSWGAAKRALPLLLVTLVIGVGLVAPYALAVIDRLGWDNIQRLLHSEVIDRTHTATNINSGSPLYYVFILPFMIAPLGLLVPLQFSKLEWREGGKEYQFAVLMPWLSIGLFSLIAGKEYEYILPCLPVMLGAAGWHVSRGMGGVLVDWEARWFKLILLVVKYILAIGGAGIIVYAVVKYRVPLLWVETAVLGALVLLLALTRLDARLDKVTRICVAMTLLVVAGLNIRSFHYQGKKSPKELAQLCGELARAGVAIESSKIFPAFTFYAEHAIPDPKSPTDLPDPKVIQDKLQGEAPYFYLTLERFVAQFSGGMKPAYTSELYGTKKLVLLGNRDPKEVLEAK